MADNWYLILGLEFDPNPVEDLVIIEAKIEEKAKYWSSKFNDFDKGPEYRRYHQLLPDIRKAMRNPDERKRMIKEACEIKYGPIDKLLISVGEKGGITENEIRKIAEKLKVDVSLVEKRRVSIGIKKEESAEIIYDKYCKEKSQNTHMYAGMKSQLKSFNCDNLYDFLFSDTSSNNASTLSCDALRQKASDRKKSDFNKHDSISGTGSKLCGHCEVIFKDNNSKADYDEYLGYLRRKEIFDHIKDTSDISDDLTEAQSKKHIGQLSAILRDKKLATDVFSAFCKIENISFTLPKPSTTKPAETTEQKQTPPPAPKPIEKPVYTPPQPAPQPESTYTPPPPAPQPARPVYTPPPAPQPQRTYTQPTSTTHSHTAAASAAKPFPKRLFVELGLLLIPFLLASSDAFLDDFHFLWLFLTLLLFYITHFGAVGFPANLFFGALC